jgi:hypothetical protein
MHAPEIPRIATVEANRGDLGEPPHHVRLLFIALKIQNSPKPAWTPCQHSIAVGLVIGNLLPANMFMLILFVMPFTDKI